MIDSSQLARVYSRVDSVQPVWKEFGEEVVMFDRASGCIHCFDLCSAELLKMLQSKDMSVGEMLVVLSNYFGSETDADLLERFVRQALSDLEVRELVSSLPS